MDTKTEGSSIRPWPRTHDSKLVTLLAFLLAAIALVGTVIWLVARMGMDLNMAAATVTIGLALIGLCFYWLQRQLDHNRRHQRSHTRC